MARKERLDRVLVKRGMAKSRERARALIMEGKVVVGGVPVYKAGTLIDPTASIEIKGQDIPYVSRGGLKLEAALREFHINVSGKVVMDVGASTGGFTDCLLKSGAMRVYAVDVGYGQLDWALRNDPRVVPVERTNIRYMDKNELPEKVDLATIDVSFISLLKVVPKVMEFLKEGGEILALVKPQFEAGRGEVEKGGIIRDEKKRLHILNKVVEGLKELGLEIKGTCTSPIKGQKGNVEYFVYLKMR
ncbi:MAG: TlyA family RNA methyltransferase [Nitrospirae bacterium]|nr:TlyA family RNA methyltransferase [Nitrospirota bacterium]